MRMPEPILALEDVAVNFGGLTALAGVSFRLGQGETLGLVGPNGAGKTTLFNTISGAIRPSRGSIRFNGQSMLRQPEYRRARAGIGRTFQIPQPLHELTVRENLVVAQRFGTGRVDMARIDRILDLLDLAHKAEAPAATGCALTEHKALEVGKALATEPRLLLLDEVLGGLETASKRAFMHTIETVRREFGLALVIIEHDIETIASLCPRVLVLNFGRLLADGTPAEVFSNPDVIRSYTGEAAA